MQTYLPAWLLSVHHDGSENDVSSLTPALGETVHLRLRTAPTAPVRRVLVRIFPDGEQAMLPMVSGPALPGLRWWEADLHIHQPRTHYRFLIEAADGAWWYNAAGPSLEMPLDSADFQILANYRPPSWLPGAVFYQIFPDRFDNADPECNPGPNDYEAHGQRPLTLPWGTPPPEGVHGSHVYYGGDLPGITRRLDYLERLGVNALYLTPVFSAHSNHRYDVIDYEHVDPHLGGDGALVALRQALDARGMRLVLDIVPNHCGYDHAWFQRARQDPTAPEADFFTFSHHPDEYATWLGVWSLPKLNYRSAELRRRMFVAPDSVFRRWLQPPFNADGWRVDVANMLGRQGATQIGDEIARGIRQAVKETAPDSYLFGENFFDATNQLQGDQWDGVMNYAGFGIPLLYWLHGFQMGAIGLREPVISPVPYPTSALVTAWASRRAAIPWVIALQQYNLTNSHDTPRLRTQVGNNDALQRLAAAALFTFPGVPGIYYGDEIGLTDLPGVRSRACMPWGDDAAWNADLLAFYRALIALRKRSPALQRGGFQVFAVEEDLFAFQRLLGSERILVIAQRSAASRPALLLDALPAGIADGTRFVEFFGRRETVVKEGALWLPELPQGATIWEQIEG
jgi:alpha-glucosidase